MLAWIEEVLTLFKLSCGGGGGGAAAVVCVLWVWAFLELGHIAAR